MGITIEQGNLLDLAAKGEFHAIMHGCNCFHGGDSGIAGQIWRRFPEAYQGKLKNHAKGAWDIFGTISSHKITEERIVTDDGGYGIDRKICIDKVPTFRIINAYTQYNGGSDFYMSAFVRILKFINATRAGKTIGIPKIGCGIGGGNWEQVEMMLLKHAPNVNWRVIVWNG